MRENDIDCVKKMDQQSSLFWPRQYYLKSLKSKNFFAFLAQKDSQCVGNIMFRLINTNVNIDKIVVKKEFRYQGIGTKLLEKAIGIGKSKNANQVFLTVSDGNIYAIDFYTKHGFVIESIQWFHYFDFDHGVKMYRTI
jgi:ribosomal protein S18 acetylase RimI-like enzyme